MDVQDYTNKIIQGIRTHFDKGFDGEPANVVRGRNGKLKVSNPLPFIHRLYVETQQAFGGMDLDFTDAVMLMDFYRSYLRVVAEINEFTEFVPTRANFCAYLGLNTDMYARLLNDVNPDVRTAMRYVEDYFVSLLQIGSIMGDLRSNPTKTILQTAGQYGHSQVTVKEASDIRATERRVLSQEELEQNLKRITTGGK